MRQLSVCGCCGRQHEAEIANMASCIVPLASCGQSDEGEICLQKKMLAKHCMAWFGLSFGGRASLGSRFVQKPGGLRFRDFGVSPKSAQRFWNNAMHKYSRLKPVA